MEVRIRTGIRVASFLADFDLDLGRQGAEQRGEVVPLRRRAQRVQRECLKPNLYHNCIEDDGRHREEL